MRITKIFRKVAANIFLAAAMLITSCATHTDSMTVGRKFNEENIASLIIRYSSDKTIYLLKPDTHDGLFYRILDRQQLCDAASNTQLDRDLAVVVIGYSRDPIIERQIRQGWIGTLANLNYRRVVFLRANDSDPVNTLRVVDDCSVVQLDVPAGQVQLAGIPVSQRVHNVPLPSP